MDKSTIIIGSLIGGAIIGSAVTICMASKSSRQMRMKAHSKIIEELKRLHEHIAGGSCMCSHGEGESCSMNEGGAPAQEAMG